jgi:HEAT repeat protein
MKIVESDPDIYVQKAAVEALGTIGDPRSVELLRTIGDGKNRFLASAARPRA